MTLEGIDFFNNKYYSHIRRFLSFIALWPFEESSKQLFYVFFIVLLMIFSANTQLCLLLMSIGKVEEITELMQTFLPALVFLAAYWNLIDNSDIMKDALERIRNDWSKLTCEDELMIMQTYAAQSKLWSQAIACAFILYIAFLISPSIIRLFLYMFGVIDMTELILPVHNKAFVTAKYVYAIAFTSELLAILMTCVIAIAHYSLFIFFLQHACALFSIVTNKIDQPFKNENKFSRAYNVPKYEAEFDWIVAVVHRYNNAIEFVELIKALYGKMYVIEVSLGFCLVIVDFIYFFQLLNFMITAAETLKIFLFINGTLLMIYAYTSIGERLIQHSSSVYAKCRLVPFYTLSVQTNKNLLLLIMWSMRPCNISISGIAVASHTLFASLIKTSFSFATVCFNMR